MKYTYKYIWMNLIYLIDVLYVQKLSGKSYLARFLIDKYKNHFDKIILICLIVFK